ncbi:putative leucine-rich repeat-containing protein [Senna tora]|uniref:Putative leucine-rich repeat-containing protein n=1 Tax=Senna tora TaxID=362788 RepID=A0A834W208_9FABA|nr:putative leucine-rich repeat-containing protein [Senna tora]
MGEIDTKPIKPVRTALSLFEDKSDLKKHQPTRSKNDYEKELEDLSKDLANHKVQLEAKSGAHKQALFKLEHSEKMAEELSSLLNKSGSERDKYMNECAEGRARIDELESKMKQMVDHQQLSHVLSELKATQRELLNKETELIAAKDSELKALTKAEQMEAAFSIEKEKKEELLQQVKQLNEAKEKLELAMEAISEAQKQVEDLRNQVEIFQGLENELVERSILIDSLQMELKQANEALVSKAMEDSKKLDQSVYLEALEKELDQLKQEHKNAKDEIKMLKERDVKSQVENALLISRLQESRSIFSDIVEVSHQSDHSNDKTKKEVQGSEVALMKKELEVSTAKIGELRARAEQAISRAELAEKAKAALENKLRRNREYGERKRGESIARQDTSSTSVGTPKVYQPLGKVLKMRF